MTPNEFLLDETRRWMAKARDDIQELGEACLELKPDLPPSVRAAFGLTQYTWLFRYPGGPREIEEGEPEEALGLAQRLYENLVAILPGQARP